MLYRDCAPPAALQAYVDAFWEVRWDGGQPVTQRILPDGCLDIILNCGVALRNPQEPGAGLAAGGLYLVGAMTRPAELAYDPGTVAFGIRFRPAGLARFVAVPLRHTADETPELAAVAPPFARQLREAGLADAATFAARGAVASRVLLAQLARCPPPDRRMQLAVQQLVASNGQLRIADAARVACLSERQFERRFAALVGLAPRQLAELVRFRTACGQLRAAPAAPLAAVAFTTGYYDAAHLARVFRRYAEQTPGRYRR